MVNYLQFSVKNLKRRGIRSWLTLLGIFIGITAVVALITLGSGLKMAVNSQFGVSSTEVITVQAGGLSGYGPPGSGVTNPLTKKDAEKIEQISGVEAAIPRSIETIQMKYKDETKIVAAMSMPEDDSIELVYDLLGIEIKDGREMREKDSRKILLGHNYLEEEKSTFQEALESGKKVEIDDKTFEVVGILEKQGSFIFDNIVAIKDDDLEEIAGYGNEVDIIAVKVRNKEEMQDIKEDIEKLLRKRRDVDKGEEDFSVETPEALLENVNNILGGVQAFIIIIASISIFVGAVGIANTMTTSVLERTKEIGIMKAIGARNKNIFLQFFIESGMLGLIGGIIGTISGLSIGYLGIIGINNFLGSEIPMNLDYVLILLVLVGSFLMGTISGTWPAWQAANKNPVDAIRG